jgi:hypothetical protein
MTERLRMEGVHLGVVEVPTPAIFDGHLDPLYEMATPAYASAPE